MKEDAICIGLMGLWTYDNYGSVLTTWSLYKFLVRNGYDVKLIDYNSQNIGRHTGDFIRSECDSTYRIVNATDLKILNEIFDIFLLGSDQNWHEAFLSPAQGFAYFFNFVNNDKKKISYATSVGKTKFEGSAWSEEISNYYLDRFDYLSVREKSTSEYYSKRLNREVKWVIDPIFFTDKSEYEKLGYNHDVMLANETGGIVEFLLDYSMAKREIGDAIERNTGVTCKTILGPDYTNGENCDLSGCIIDIPVVEMINTLAKSTYIVTDSYHITCLAIILHKPFLSILNTRRGAERFESLLGPIDLTDRLINEEDTLRTDLHLILQKQVNWERVDDYLNKWKKESIEWLLNALSSEKIRSNTEDNRLITSLIDQVVILQERLTSLSDSLMSVADICYKHESKLLLLTRYRDEKIRKHILEGLNEGNRIAFRCAGIHTIKLLEILKDSFDEKRIQIVCIVDNGNAVLPELKDNYHLINTEEFYSKYLNDIDAVIVSSSKYRTEIKTELNDKLTSNCNIKIIDPYDAFCELDLNDDQAWYEL